MTEPQFYLDAAQHLFAIKWLLATLVMLTAFALITRR